MATIEPGKWYLFVTCRNPNCSRGITFREAPSPLVEDSPLPKIIELRCPSCGTNGLWSQDQVQRSQGTKMQ